MKKKRYGIKKEIGSEERRRGRVEEKQEEGNEEKRSGKE